MLAPAVKAIVKTPETAKMAAKRSFRIQKSPPLPRSPRRLRAQCVTNRAQSPGATATAVGGLARKRAVTPPAMARNFTPPTTAAKPASPEVN